MAWDHDGKIPWDEKGNPMSYPGYGFVSLKEWRDNTPFEASLLYDGYSRGRSSALIMFVDMETGVKYPMFLSDFDDCARMMNQGRLFGTWKFVKKGANYGIQLQQEKGFVDA